MEKMSPGEEITADRVKWQLRCYRSHRANAEAPVSNSTAASQGAAVAATRAAAHHNKDDDDNGSDDQKKSAHAPLSSPSPNSFQLPYFTKDEQQSPVVSCLGGLVEILHTLTNELEAQRAGKTATSKAAAAPGHGWVAPSLKRSTMVHQSPGSGDRPTSGSPHKRRRFLSPSNTKISRSHSPGTILFRVGDHPTSQDTMYNEQQLRQRPFGAFESSGGSLLPSTYRGHRHPQSLPERIGSAYPVANVYSFHGGRSGDDRRGMDPSLHNGDIDYSTSRRPHHPASYHHLSGHGNDQVVEEHLFESLKAYCNGSFPRPPPPNDRSE